ALRPPRRPGSCPSIPGSGWKKGASDLGREGSPPPARRVASEGSERRGFSRAGPGASRKTTGIGGSSRSGGMKAARRPPLLGGALDVGGAVMRAMAIKTWPASESRIALSTGKGFCPFSTIWNTMFWL
ncbi:MAG: hypothetical protein M3542_10655, partial [Acidobacteriota bacterium]|nr:hypothetical protein [Acidobacteriota bacterium]